MVWFGLVWFALIRFGLAIEVDFPNCQVVTAASLARVVDQLDSGGICFHIFSLSSQYLDNNIG